LYRCLALDFLYPAPQDLVTFADNHDMDRIYARIGEDLERWKMAMAYLMVTRGIPQIFYGTEVLISNGDDPKHGVIRADMPGGWPDDPVSAFTGEGLDEEQLQAQEYLQSLLQWRKGKSVIHTGHTLHFVPEDAQGIYTLFRYDDENIVMLVLNTSDEKKSIPLEKYDELLQGIEEGRDVLNDSEIDLKSGALSLSADSVLILEMNH
ncbi:MAG: alpha-amylase, partial [Flavobacteriales bacterium]|nr:alpha-amylase [Flavobacteriales bacterium]